MRLSLEREEAAAYTPAGIYRPNGGLSANTQKTRREVRKAAEAAEREGVGAGGAAGWKLRQTTMLYYSIILL